MLYIYIYNRFIIFRKNLTATRGVYMFLVVRICNIYLFFLSASHDDYIESLLGPIVSNVRVTI